MTCRLVEHGSSEYEATVALRYEVLRRPLGLEFSPEQLAAESSDLHCTLWDDAELVGCLVLTPLNEREIKMRQVAIHPDRQGQGLGRELVEFCEDEARKLGFVEMVLHARDTAVPFYLRLGYELEGDPFTEVGIPHRKMRKML